MTTTKRLTGLLVILSIAILFSSCSVIRPGEVALKVRLGKIQPDIL